MPNRTLALEIGSTAIRGVLVESSLRSQRILGAYTIPRTSTDNLAHDIATFATTHGLAWDEVVSALPGDVVTHRLLTLPFRDRKRLDQVVPSELESQLPFEIDGSVIDYQVIGETEGQALILAALAPKEAIRSHLATLAAAGIEPRVIDLAPLAPLNLLRHGEPGVTEAVVAIVDHDRTTLALVHEAQLGGLRTLSAGVSGASDVDTLVSQVRWSIGALSQNGSMHEATLWLGGEAAGTPGLADAMGRALDLPPRHLDELAIPSVPPTLRREQPAYAMPLGLALRDRATNGSIGMDFRRGEFTYHRERDALWQMLTGASILLIIGLLLMATAFVLEGRRLGQQRDAVQAEIRALFTAAMPTTTTIVNEKAQLQAELSALEKRRHQYGRLAPSAPRAIDLLRALTQGVPPDVPLDLQELNLDADTMKIRGSTRTYEGVEAVKRGLGARPEFREVQAKDVRASVDGQRVAFGLDISTSTGERP